MYNGSSKLSFREVTFWEPGFPIIIILISPSRASETKGPDPCTRYQVSGNDYEPSRSLRIN